MTARHFVPTAKKKIWKTNQHIGDTLLDFTRRIFPLVNQLIVVKARVHHSNFRGAKTSGGSSSIQSFVTFSHFLELCDTKKWKKIPQKDLEHNLAFQAQPPLIITKKIMGMKTSK